MRKQGIVFAASILALAILSGSGQALARSVFLNGANIDSVRNQTLKKVDLFIDSEGNVHIEAPEYKVMEEGSSPAQPAVQPSGQNPYLNNRYFMVVESNRQGAVQYDLEVVINGQLVRKIKSDEPQLILEISLFLKPGANQVKIVATKNLSGPRVSSSDKDQMRIVIGQGQAVGQQVTINSSLVVFTCSAADTRNFERQYQLDAR